MARSCNFCKEEKLEQAMNLFWQKGYEGTSVADLVEHLGINRFSLYNSFGDKLTLYRDALRRYLYTRGLTGLEALEADDADMDALINLVEEFAAKQKDQQFGCFMQNALLERCVEDDEVRRLGNELFEGLEQAFCKVIARYQTQARAAELAAFLVMQLQGIRVLGKSGQFALLDAAMVVLRGEIQRWKTPA